MKKYLITIVALAMMLCIVVTSFFVGKNIFGEVEESPLLNFSTLEELFPPIEYEYDDTEFEAEKDSTTDKPSQESQTAVKVDTPLEKEFRTLYTNYNEENTDILNDNFTALTNSVINLPDEHADILVEVTTKYVDTLFTKISSDKEKSDEIVNSIINAINIPSQAPTEKTELSESFEKGEKSEEEVIEIINQEVEDEFVKEEAAAFEEIVHFVNNIVEEKDVETSEVYSMTKAVSESEAMHDTIMDTAYTSTGAEITDLYNEAGENTKSIIDKAVIDVDSASKEYGIEEIGEAFKHMF